MKNCSNRNCDVKYEGRSKYCSKECNKKELNLKRIKKLNLRFVNLKESYDYLVCPECEQKVVEITNNHCKMHGCTTNEFKEKHNLKYLQCEKKRNNFAEINPWNEHGGKYSPFSEKNEKYDKKWHENWAKNHSEFQKISDTNLFRPENWDNQEKYKKFQLRDNQYFIDKYGEEEGKKRAQVRIDKWQDSLTAKSQEEIDDINKRKFSAGGHSKISQELFEMLDYQNKGARYGINGGEYRVKFNNGKHASFDFHLLETKKVIEFNGDVWHANPNFYKKSDKPLKKFFNAKITAEEIWAKDKERQILIESLGYEVFIVWENDYKNNKKEIIKQCLNFLKK